MVTKKLDVSTEHNSVFALTPHDAQAFEDARKVIEEKYPRIFRMIEATWGSKELHQKLTSLLHVDNAKREGFPIDVCEALIVIQDRHSDDFGFSPFIDTFIDSRLPDQW